MKRARDQERAVKAIEAVGGEVQYDYQSAFPNPIMPRPSPPGPKWLRDLIGVHYFDSVARVALTGPGVNDESLRAINRLPDLKGFLLAGTKTADAGLMHLEGLTNLEVLASKRNNMYN